jgi:hypothetical protein
MRIGVIGVKQGIILYTGVEKGGSKAARSRAGQRKAKLESKGLQVFLIENPDMRKIRLYDTWKGGHSCRQ